MKKIKKMKKIKRILLTLLILVSFILFNSCIPTSTPEPAPIVVEDWSHAGYEIPGEHWVGKTFKIDFGPNWGRSLKDKIFTLRIGNIQENETVDGDKRYFETDSYAENNMNQVYFKWFNSSSRPRVIRWRLVE